MNGATIIKSLRRLLLNHCGRKGKIKVNEIKQHMVEWEVHLRGRHIDSVWFGPDMDEWHAREALVNHDGYDALITLKRGRTGRKTPMQIEHLHAGTKRMKI